MIGSLRSVLGTGVLTFGVLLVFGLSSGASSGDADISDDSTSSGSGDDRKPRAHVFEPYPPGPAAIPFAEQPREEQLRLERTAESVDLNQGYEVHQAWSRASESARERAQKAKAEHEAGLEDTETLGVE